MVINDFILQNEKLAAVMIAYSSEIDRLERFSALVREKPLQESEINYKLLQNLDRKISKAKETFTTWNDAYGEEEHKRDDRDRTAELFIPEIKAWCKDIEDILLRTNITPLPWY